MLKIGDVVEATTEIELPFLDEGGTAQVAVGTTFEVVDLMEGGKVVWVRYGYGLIGIPSTSLRRV
ncbi:hypothetical protein [Listeria costaricensis]|uniref:hypothetical protein n=1 Tax=Listeria costaricensis TaxID=2026604 RepID=UPI000C07455D|nr:hypothetical protein [Listeria costaricensis]